MPKVLTWSACFSRNTLLGALNRFAARAYVTGSRLEDALEVRARLKGLGIAGSVGFWNARSETPRRVADEHIAVIERLAAERSDCNVSIKAPPLGYERALFREIVQRADDENIAVQLDAEAYESAAPTWQLVVDGARRHYPVGVTLPGRWRRSLADAERAIDLGVRVRVVQGRWPDPTVPGLSPRLGFLAVIDQLAGQARHVAVATHDCDLARTALERLKAHGTPCELELLFGLPIKPLLGLARELDVAVRVYTPYGQPSLPYELSEIRDPRIMVRGMRDLVLGRSFRLAVG